MLELPEMIFDRGLGDAANFAEFFCGRSLWFFKKMLKNLLLASVQVLHGITASGAGFPFKQFKQVVLFISEAYLLIQAKQIAYDLKPTAVLGHERSSHMKALNLIALAIIATSTSAFAANPLEDVKSIECQKTDGAQDFWTLTPNTFVKGEQTFVAVTGHKVFDIRLEDGSSKTVREEKPVFFYEAKPEIAKDGSTFIRLGLTRQAHYAKCGAS